MQAKKVTQVVNLGTERNTGFEPVTLRAAIERSTTELTAHNPAKCARRLVPIVVGRIFWVIDLTAKDDI